MEKNLVDVKKSGFIKKIPAETGVYKFLRIKKFFMLEKVSTSNQGFPLILLANFSQKLRRWSQVLNTFHILLPKTNLNL